MRVLIACERSGITREMFELAGHEAYSWDILAPEKPSKFHVQDDIFNIEDPSMFDLMIAYPPCTHLCVSGARWFKNKQVEQSQAIDFVKWLMNLPIERICIENPIGVLSTKIRKPDQIIQPWQFGHGETKATCLWLKNLPRLESTWEISHPVNRVHTMPPGENRSMERSRSYIGIAFAMAKQWGSLEPEMGIIERQAEVKNWVMGN